MLRLIPVCLVLAGLAASASPASAQAPADPGGPLVYTFVLDGLDGDRVDQGRAPFISSLLAGQQAARSTYFRESRSIMVAETNPNHAAMATGAYAERSGIPGNSFGVYAPSDGSTCPAGPIDETRAPVTTDGTDPGCLKAETIFEAVQRQAGAERNVTAGIFGKPKLASLFAGRKVDPSRYDADHLWTPCVSPSDDKPYCKQEPNRVFDEYAVLDSTVMDEVIQTVDEGVPGDGRTFDGGGTRPNLTFVNFPGVDSSGHTTGANAEYDAAIGRADDQIARFVANQKRLGLWERTVMVLLSDHSMDTTPGKTTLSQRFETAGIDGDSYRVVQNGSAALVYLTNRNDPDRFLLLKAMREAATDSDPIVDAVNPPAVEALYREENPADGGTANTVAARHPAWRLGGPRSGDLVVTARSASSSPLRPAASFNEPNPLIGNHGGPQTRDNFFAVVGGSDLVNQRTLESAQDPLFDDTERNEEQSENVDVAPTVLRLLGLGDPAQNQGRFLSEAFRADRVPPLGGAAAASAGGAPGATVAATSNAAPTGASTSGGASCAARTGFASATATGSGTGGIAFTFERRRVAPATVELFQSSLGARPLGPRRVARFTRRSESFRWAGRRDLRDGVYFARLTITGADGRPDVERVALLRRGGRFSRRPAFARRPTCTTVSAFKINRPAFGGPGNLAIDGSYRLSRAATVTVDLLRGNRVVRRLRPTSQRSADRTYKFRIGSDGLPRGDYRVRLRVVRGGTTTTTALTTRRI